MPWSLYCCRFVDIQQSFSWNFSIKDGNDYSIWPNWGERNRRLKISLMHLCSDKNKSSLSIDITYMYVDLIYMKLDRLYLVVNGVSLQRQHCFEYFQQRYDPDCLRISLSPVSCLIEIFLSLFQRPWGSIRRWMVSSQRESFCTEMVLGMDNCLLWWNTRCHSCWSVSRPCRVEWPISRMFDLSFLNPNIEDYMLYQGCH